MDPSDRFKKSLTNDNLWIYILSLLKKRDMYPYEINASIKKEFGFTPGNITAYIVLKKLKIDGYVTISRREKNGGPSRTYYSITRKGKNEITRAKILVKKLRF